MPRENLAEFMVREFDALTPEVQGAQDRGPAPAEAALPFSRREELLQSGTSDLETGYARIPDGMLYVAVRHELPGVSCAMINWWFAWHGTDERYQLWHPKDHKRARWKGPGPGGDPAESYAFVGHTSLVEESLNGGPVLPLVIRFRGPEDFFPPGAWSRFVNSRPSGSRPLAVCARSGSLSPPMEAGHLVHLVTDTAEGCVMRSRFWLGDMKGHGLRAPLGWLTNLPRVRARTFPDDLGRNLLVHCAREMGHFPSFLPSPYKRFGSKL